MWLGYLGSLAEPESIENELSASKNGYYWAFNYCGHTGLDPLVDRVLKTVYKEIALGDTSDDPLERSL